jgi:hypothetical protein
VVSTAILHRKQEGHGTLNDDYDLVMAEFVTDFEGKHCRVRAGMYMVDERETDELGQMVSIVQSVLFR